MKSPSSHDAPKPVYLGDSVYAEMDGDMVKLTTQNGLGPTNTIWLEPYVVQQLVEFTQRHLGIPGTSDG